MFSGPVKREIRAAATKRMAGGGTSDFGLFWPSVEPAGRLVVWGDTVAIQLEMEPEDKEEARFIARLASRDERAFNELVVLYQERVNCG